MISPMLCDSLNAGMIIETSVLLILFISLSALSDLSIPNMALSNQIGKRHIYHNTTTGQKFPFFSGSASKKIPPYPSIDVIYSLNP
jgi:hypothetical protein